MESLAASRTTVAKRMLQFYVPIGVNRRAFFPGEGDQVLPDFGKFAAKKADKKVKAYDFPIGSKPLQQLTPTLQPLESVKEKVSLITGLMRTKQEGTDVHAQCASCYLSSADPNVGVSNSQYPLSRSLDHIVADTIGSKTP